MASPASTKPILDFHPFVSQDATPNNHSLSKLHHILVTHPEAKKIPEKMKALALIYFAQYSSVFNSDRLNIHIHESPDGRKVVVMDTMFKEIQVNFKERSEDIYYEENTERKNLCEMAGIQLVIYANCFRGKVLSIWTQSMLDNFLKITP